MDVSSHVETVVLLGRKDIKPDTYIRLGLDVDDYYRMKKTC